jgi:rod shape-determining protein MreC
VILPTQKVFLNVGQGFTNFFSFLTFWKSGASKISYLEQRVRELTVEAEKVNNLTLENESLRSQLGVPVSKNKKIVMANVVGTSVNLLIDKGQKDGIKEGLPVVYKDILVGKTTKVLENSSTVLILTDPSSKVTVTTSKTKAKGLLIGQFGVGVLMDKVVSEDVLSSEDVVVTSGEDGIIKGLLVGKIAEVKKEDAGVFQSAKISLLLDYQKLNQVFVIIGE